MTNLVGKWAVHESGRWEGVSWRDYPVQEGEIMAVTYTTNGSLFLYIRKVDGTLRQINYSGTKILDRRPDTEGPYR